MCHLCPVRCVLSAAELCIAMDGGIMTVMRACPLCIAGVHGSAQGAGKGDRQEVSKECGMERGMECKFKRDIGYGNKKVTVGG